MGVTEAFGVGIGVVGSIVVERQVSDPTGAGRTSGRGVEKGIGVSVPVAVAVALATIEVGCFALDPIKGENLRNGMSEANCSAMQSASSNVALAVI